MVNRIVLMLFLSFSASILYAQPCKEKGGIVFHDIMSGEKVIKLLDKEIDGNIATYYYSTKDTLFYNVMFTGGYDCLKQHFDSVYYAGITDYDEINKYIVCSILFDDRLKIKEVHILDVYSNPYYFRPYYKLIEKAILSTEGKWYWGNSKSKDKGAVFLFPHRISVVPTP